jgi:hypothetical protein
VSWFDGVLIRFRNYSDRSDVGNASPHDPWPISVMRTPVALPPYSNRGVPAMPITRLLADSGLAPEQRHVIELAFNSTLRKLGLVDRNDPVCEMVARKVFELGASGVTNAVAITEIAYRQLHPA